MRTVPETDKGAAGGWSMALSVSAGGGTATCEAGQVRAVPAAQHSLTWNSALQRYEVGRCRLTLSKPHVDSAYDSAYNSAYDSAIDNA